jgi:hypothetical protein
MLRGRKLYKSTTSFLWIKEEYNKVKNLFSFLTLLFGSFFGELKKNKKGQTFIIAALIIAVILMGFNTIWVSTNFQEEDRAVYDLSKEIDFEGKKVIDYGVFTGKTPAVIISNITTLMGYYVKENPNSEIFIIYGNRSGVTVINNSVSCKTGNIGLGSNVGGCTSYGGSPPASRAFPVSQTGVVRVPISGQDYTFTLEDNQDFYVVLVRQAGEDTVAGTGAPPAGQGCAGDECDGSTHIIYCNGETATTTGTPSASTLCTDNGLPTGIGTLCYPSTPAYCGDCSESPPNNKRCSLISNHIEDFYQQCANGRWQEFRCVSGKCSNGEC